MNKFGHSRLPAEETEVGMKWNSLSREERKEIIRMAVPSGKWDFYADSSWGNLFGGIMDRLEKFLK